MKASWEKDKPDYGVFIKEKGECLFLPVVIMQLNERGRIPWKNTQEELQRMFIGEKCKSI